MPPNLAPTWAHLGSSWAPRPTWAQLGANLGPTWLQLSANASKLSANAGPGNFLRTPQRLQNQSELLKNATTAATFSWTAWQLYFSRRMATYATLVYIYIYIYMCIYISRSLCMYMCVCVSRALSIYIYISLSRSRSLSLSLYIYIYISIYN